MGTRSATDVTTRRFVELTAAEFHDIARLRSEVFVVEQACVYLDLDGRDAEATTEHHWIDADGTIACYARSLAEPDGQTSPDSDDSDDNTVRIGRVVTAPSARGRGLAGALITSLVDRFAASTIVLDAQAHLAGWYAGFGFEAVGDEFLEDGIPHQEMRLTRT